MIAFIFIISPKSYFSFLTTTCFFSPQLLLRYFVYSFQQVFLWLPWDSRIAKVKREWIMEWLQASSNLPTTALYLIIVSGPALVKNYILKYFGEAVQSAVTVKHFWWFTYWFSAIYGLTSNGLFTSQASLAGNYNSLPVLFSSPILMLILPTIHAHKSNFQLMRYCVASLKSQWLEVFTFLQSLSKSWPYNAFIHHGIEFLHANHVLQNCSWAAQS